MFLLARVLGRPSRMLRAGRFFVAATLIAAMHAASAAEPKIVVRAFGDVAYADARAALEDAIIEEGLVPPTVSGFGAMLARTAPDLGHHLDLYREAEIFSFCSARIAARMAAEDPSHIALCPLTLSLYTLPAEPARVYLAYRPPGLDSPAGRLAADMLGRIVSRTAAGLGRKP